MVKILISCLLAAFIALTVANASADLNSITYLKAKAAYNEKNWSNARMLLMQYEAEDAVFLNKNPAIKEAIAKAISYCGDMTAPKSMYAAGIRMVPAPQPTLP